MGPAHGTVRRAWPPHLAKHPSKSLWHTAAISAEPSDDAPVLSWGCAAGMPTLPLLASTPQLMGGAAWCVGLARSAVLVVRSVADCASAAGLRTVQPHGGCRLVWRVHGVLVRAVGAGAGVAAERSAGACIKSITSPPLLLVFSVALLRTL